ncbi:MAG: DNA alkylation repair protein [Phycisphaerales bacterium]
MASKVTHHGPWYAVRAALRDAADPAAVARCTTIAPTKGTVLGVRVPVIRAMVKEFAAATKGLTVSDAADMADLAFASGRREEMLFATFLLARFRAKLEPAHWPKLDRWINGIDNWETCDQLAMGVAGEMIGRAVDPQRGMWVRDLEEWAVAPNPWRRRFAVATTTVLNQKGRSDARTALRICERAIADDDRNVQKAVGWALREACKSDPAAVFALLERHRAAMSRPVLRESAAKLTASQRARLGVASERGARATGDRARLSLARGRSRE